MNKVRFNTTQYVFNHGKAPRGFGLWMFQIVVGGSTLTRSSTGCMSYTHAKFEIAAKAKELGATEVRVLA